MSMEQKTFRQKVVVNASMAVAALAILWGAAQRCQSEPPRRAAPVEASGPAASLQDSFAQVAGAVKPSVVSITAVHVENVQVVPPEFFFGDPFQDFFDQFQERPRRPRQPSQSQPKTMQRRSQGLGSGVIIDPKGYVLTNEHVVRGADELTVNMPDQGDKKYHAKVMGTDPRTDLAVIKIIEKGTFPAAVVGDSDRVRVGDWAIAVGSPFGLEQTVTVGVISAVRQSLSIEGVNYANMLQTDAAINRGNSGGPLLNLKGEVIGVNSAIYAPTGVFAGIGFAIPSNRAKEIMEQLISKGKVVRGWMGVEVAAVDEVIAQQFKIPEGKGVLINNVLPGSPAEAAGLKRGDVIVEFGGHKTPTQEALLDAVGHTAPRTKVKVVVLRDGKKVEADLTAGEMPSSTEVSTEEGGSPGDSSPESAKPSEWEGARLAKLSPALAERYAIPAKETGVVVTGVVPGGVAEEMGLIEGDLITSFNREKTPDPEAFLKTAKKADARKGILLDVFRRGRWIYLSHRETP
jgi:serine protease Do